MQTSTQFTREEMMGSKTKDSYAIDELEDRLRGMNSRFINFEDEFNVLKGRVEYKFQLMQDMLNKKPNDSEIDKLRDALSKTSLLFTELKS